MRDEFAGIQLERLANPTSKDIPETPSVRNPAGLEPYSANALTPSEIRHLNRQAAFLPSVAEVNTVLTQPMAVMSVKLQQNHPNPFNPTTSISNDVPMDTHVTLTVFNSIGQQVNELYNGIRSPGKYTATFDASGLSSGTYFCRINAGNFVETRKMMLVR